MSKVQSFIEGDPKFWKKNKLEITQINIREGSKGVRTPFRENPKKMYLLGFEIWHYRTKFSTDFQQFSNHFSIFIMHAKVVPHSGLLKKTKIYSFLEIFQAPQKIFIPTTILKSSEWAENIMPWNLMITLDLKIGANDQ